MIPVKNKHAVSGKPLVKEKAFQCAVVNHTNGKACQDTITILAESYAEMRKSWPQPS